MWDSFSYQALWQQVHARTLALEGFDGASLARLADAHVLAIGAGGLGSACLPLLLRQGVGHLTLYEFDSVTPSNLPRQLLYTVEDIGGSKGEIARQRLTQWAPWTVVELREKPFTSECQEDLEGYRFDLAIDCSDNFRTAFALNALCKRKRIPMLWAGVEDYIGLLTLLHGNHGTDLEDIITPEDSSAPTSEAVFAPAVQMMGALMAGEAMKCLLHIEPSLDGALLHVDLRDYTFHRLTL